MSASNLDDSTRLIDSYLLEGFIENTIGGLEKGVGLGIPIWVIETPRGIETQVREFIDMEKGVVG